MTLFHDRRAAIDGRRDSEILVRDAPQQFYSRGIFGVGFGEAGDFSKTIEDEAQALSISGFTEILLDAGCAPQGCDVGTGDEQYALR